MNNASSTEQHSMAGQTETAQSKGVRPTFINIGPGRCATSWLLEALKAHPEIEMAKVKETEYFNTNFDRDVDWYESHFSVGSNNAQAIGEISNNYYLDASVAPVSYTHLTLPTICSV